MTIITASNGYKYRPLAETDETFIMESLKDYPIGSNTYQQRLNEFSNFLYVTEGFNETAVKNKTSPQSITMVTEKSGGTAVGFQHITIDNLVVNLAMGATHPSHKRQGHSTARLMLLGEFAYTHLGCSGTWLEIVNTDEVKQVADTWRGDISADETQRANENKFGDSQTYTLNKIQITAAEHETHRAAHSTWGSITYTIS
tara:strand:+ start:153 stop:752 length:600 start_codon:yes stop_codon:yes gene_type:complete